MASILVKKVTVGTPISGVQDLNVFNLGGVGNGDLLVYDSASGEFKADSDTYLKVSTFNASGTGLDSAAVRGLFSVSGDLSYDSASAQFSIDVESVYTSANFDSDLGAASLTSVGALNSGSITSGFGNIDIGSSTFTTTGTVNAGAITVGSAELSEAELEILDGATVTTAELNILDGVTSTATELNILDGVTATAAELNILDGVTSTAAELNILDGVTATAGELSILDGDTSATSTTVADADRVVLNDGGTMKQVAVTDLNAYFSGGTVVKADDVQTGDAAVTITTSVGDITIDAAANDTDIIFKGTDGGVDTTFLTLDGSAGGAATFTSTITAAGTSVFTNLDISGNVDIDGSLETDALSINGTSVSATAAELNILDGVTSTTAELNILDGVTSTAAELNILDGVTATAAELNILDGVTASAAEINIIDGTTSASSVTLVDADRIVTNHGGTMKQVAVTDFAAYFDDEITAMANLVTVGALNSGSITSGFGAIDNGTSGIRTNTFVAETAYNPDANDGATLGTTSLGFADAFLADGGTIQFGDDQDVTLTHIPDAGLRLNSTMALQFNDASQFINAPSATVLDITATDEVEINATLADINANLDVSGTYTGGGLMTTGGNIVIPDGGLIGSASDVNAIQIEADGDIVISQDLAVAGNLTVTGTTTQVDTVTMNASNAVVFEGATADSNETTLTIIDPDADRTINLPNQSGTIPVLAAVSATAITSTPEELNILDGVTSTTAELNLLDGVTSTTTELNIVDGNTSATSTTVADADRVVFNDAGTMKQVAVTDLSAYFDDKITAMPNLVSTGALDTGSITSGFGTINTGASAITTTGLISGGSLDIDDVLINGTTIGHTDDTDLITLANGLVTIAGEISVTTLDIGGTNVTSTAAELNILDGVTSTTAELNILDGVTSTAAELNILDGVTATAAELNILDGVTSTATELNILDGVTSTAAELNILDGDTSASTVTLADADRVVVNDAGTMKQVAMTALNAYMSAGSTVAADDIQAGNAAVNITTSAGNITIDAAADDTDIILKGTDGGVDTTFLTIDGSAAGKATFNDEVVAAALTIDNVVINGATIGHGNDTDLMTVADGILTVAGEVQMTTLDIGGTNVTATAAELNILDGVTSTASELNILDGVTATAAELNILDGDTSASSVTVADADRVVFNDNGTMKQVAMSDINTYVSAGTTVAADDINAGDSDVAITTTSGGITIGPGASDADIIFKGNDGGSEITALTLDISAAGKATFNNEIVATALDISGDVDIDGTLETDALSINGTAVTASAADINLIDGITNGTVIASKAIITDANKDITGGRNITISGELDAATLDISGDADIDGTLEADAITIGGVTLAETISDTVGAMVTSNTETGIAVTYDDADNTLDFVIGTLNQNTTGSAATLTTPRTIHGVSFDGSANIDLSEVISDTVGAMVGSNTETGISVTYQDGDNTIDFALDAAQTTITSLLATDIKIGEDDQTKIDFETADEIHFYAANAHQIKLVDGALVPVTDNDIDLGTSSLEFKNAYFDGTVTSDAFAGPLTGDVTGNVSGTAATVTGAAQSAITSVGTLSALTVTGDVIFDSSNGISMVWDASDHALEFDNYAKARFGDGNDMEIYSVGTSAIIDMPQNNNLYIRGGDIILRKYTNGGDYLVANEDASVDIYYSGSKKFETTNTGISVTGEVAATTGTFTNTTTDDTLLLTSTDSSSTASPVMTFKRNSASVADADYLGQLKFKGENDADQEVIYAKVTAKIDDASDGSEDGLLEFSNIKAGSNNIGARLTSTALKLINGTTLEANDGITVDNITIDGTEIDLSSGDLTLDVAGDIILDADGGDVKINDGGTAIAELTNSSTDFVIKSVTSDKDIILKGNDGGSEITALTLDMSAAGAATFNDKITAVGTSVFTNLDISGDVDVDGTLETDALSINGTAVTATAAELNILDGVTATATELNLIDGVTATTAELNILDGVTSTAAELNILDSATITTAELNLLDGGTARGTTAVASGDGILINDAGTMRMTNVDTVSTYFSSHNVGGANIVTTGALNSGSITSGFGNINNGSSTITTTGAVSTGTLAASTGTFSGILKTDDTTEATSTTDGSLQTDGGLSVAKDIVAGDDIKLLSDASVVAFGADGDVTLTHVADTGLLLNGTSVIQFNDASQNIGAPSGTVLDINATDEIELNATLVDINANVEISGNLTVAGTTTQVDTVTMNAQNAVVFEGATADSNETTLTIIDPTADRTINLPNVSGTLPVLAAASTTQITSTPEELNILDGVTSTAAELNILDGVTSTAAELNILDGVTSTATELNLLDGSSANSVVNSKAVVYGSSGELAGTLSTAAQGNVTSLGTLTALTVDNITIDGTEIDLSSGDLTLDVAGRIDLSADDNGEVRLFDGSSQYAQFKDDDDRLKIQSMIQDKDMMFVGNDGGSEVTALKLDMSDSGSAIFSHNITVPGVVTAASLDISGDVDVDGTLEADAITLGGTALATSATTDTTNASNIGSGTLAAARMAAAQTAITSILATDVKIGEDDQTKIDFETADEIHFYAANAHQIKLVDGALVPVTDNDIDLGTSSLEFKNAYFDGTVTSDAFAGPLTGDVTGNVSGSAATVTGGAQSAITSLGTLSTLTVDDITINGSTISDAGNLILDVGGDIELNADGGDVLLKDASVTFGSFINNSSSLQINANTQDKDIIFTGNDGGSSITALTLDMSDSGSAAFNHNISVPDAGEIQLGADGDFRFFHDGSHNYIKGVTSDQDVIIQGNDGGSNITALTLDMSAAGAATFNSTVTATGFVGPLTGNVTGNVSGSAGSATGNAATATALANARTIGGVSFDGTANINLPGVNSAGNQNTSGSAATLTTARTIGGVSFDGSANINLPGVNTAGNQNTSGSAATLTTARTINGTSFDGSANITLGAGSVTHAMLAADCIDGDNIGNDVINSEHYAAGSIDNEHIADNAINSEHYADGSIDTAHIGDLQVTTAKIAADAITAAKIGNDVINSEHYAAGSIDHEHLSADCVDKDNLASLATLLILDSAGSTLRTFHCAGS